MTEKRELSIEETFQELDKLLEALDSEQSGLEETFARYQKGLEYVKLLKGKIDGIEKKLAVLEAENGENDA